LTRRDRERERERERERDRGKGGGGEYDKVGDTIKSGIKIEKGLDY